MSQKDSGIKYLFAGLGLVLGLGLVALFFQPFWIWIQYRTPKSVPIQTLASTDTHEGGQVLVEGVVDPRHSFVVKEPGGDRLLEIRLVLADDKPMREWRNAIERDVDLFRTHAQIAANDGLEQDTNIKDWLKEIDNYDSRWNTSAGRLATTIRDAWPNHAIGVARVCDECSETGMRNKVHAERGWILEDFEPQGGVQQRPPWPDDIVLSNPIKRSELPVLTAYLEAEAAYYDGAAKQALAELDALAPDRSFGRVDTFIGTVHPMPMKAFEAFEAIDDLKEHVFYYVREGETPPTVGLYTVPVGALICLVMLILLLKWAVGGGSSRYAKLAGD